jgi:thiol-disulfide isomerase/thioredoxin
MYKSWLPLFSIILIVALVIAITFSNVEAKEKQQRLASNFTLKNLEGEDVSLSQFRGKYLLINFWATWCAPCKIEMPSLEKLYRQFKSNNFDMIGISILHGAHHVAQKLIRRYLPLNCERLTSSPSRFLRVKLLASRCCFSLASTFEKVIAITNATIKIIEKRGNQDLYMCEWRIL